MGKKVISIEYSLKDANTKEDLDSNVGLDPLEFVTGAGQIIYGLESELIKMDIGAKTDVLVKPSDGYGEISQEAIQTLPKEQFSDIELEKGMSLYGTGEDGQTVQVVVKSFDDKNVVIDYNHPMAGKTLLFTVEILTSREATEEEIQTGVVGGVASSGGCCGGGGCGSDSHAHEHKAGECGSGSCSS
ncbi:FKBP-type peptidyl-prolyl cis-trans isomerase SlyD [hydrothermal vent metagenome]|uniref:peptidylprolyl isomerase n=1 Tax=hydrothermal vent metagenome TaxID=652676 RepID=A0A3B1EA22_9ZZZZ